MHNFLPKTHAILLNERSMLINGGDYGFCLEKDGGLAAF
jgi:hypothetical protein